MNESEEKEELPDQDTKVNTDVQVKQENKDEPGPIYSSFNANDGVG